MTGEILSLSGSQKMLKSGEAPSKKHVRKGHDWTAVGWLLGGFGWSQDLVTWGTLKRLAVFNHGLFPVPHSPQPVWMPRTAIILFCKDLWRISLSMACIPMTCRRDP